MDRCEEGKGRRGGFQDIVMPELREGDREEVADAEANLIGGFFQNLSSPGKDISGMRAEQEVWPAWYNLIDCGIRRRD